ncbi:MULTISPECIES: hypothetical protein [unclassified Microbacterium]|uniref:hypothetical protein n=1 Tax=unclassified Microbacterium TaxID=2609290 RepID=UPI003870BAD0
MTRTVTASAFTALALATSLAFAGCASGGTEPNTSNESAAPAESSAPAAPAVEPAAGETVSGEGYSFKVPEGWGFPEDVPAGYDPSMFSADLTDADGFADNVNIITSPAGEITPEQVETAGVAELEGAGATNVTALDRVTIGGKESAHLTAGFSAEGVDYTVDQYYLTADGQTHIVTFSFSPGVGQAERDELAESVLATWTWS